MHIPLNGISLSSHRLSSLFILCFLLDNFKLPIYFTDSFFCLIKSIVEAPYSSFSLYTFYCSVPQRRFSCTPPSCPWGLGLGVSLLIIQNLPVRRTTKYHPQMSNTHCYVKTCQARSHSDTRDNVQQEETKAVTSGSSHRLLKAPAFGVLERWPQEPGLQQVTSQPQGKSPGSEIVQGVFNKVPWKLCPRG